MPPKAAPKKRLALLRRRFRELIEWAFDGNLSLAARALEMPVSTVHKYYKEGPRRLSASAVETIERVIGGGIGRWIAGDDDPYTGKKPRDINQVCGSTGIIGETDDMVYVVPNVVLWRVRRVIEAMGRHSDASEEERERVCFATVIEAMKAGILASPVRVGRFRPVVAGRPGSPREWSDPRAALGFDRHRAKEVHQLCAYWETQLGIEA